MSEAQPPVFRRLILELAPGPADARAMRRAAEFARDFGLDLHGVYVEDEALLNLSGFSFAREIRLPTNDWRKLDATGLADELRQQAEAARLLLRRLLDQMGLRGGFEVRRGDPMVCVAGVCSPADIVVVSGAMRARAPQRDPLRHAAALAPASVLVMPERPAPQGGTIVVLTDRSDDPGVALAARIAADRHAPLLILTPDDQAEPGWAGAVECRSIPSLRADDLLRALTQVRERLVIITHGAAAITGMEGAARVAATTLVPVLVL